MLDTLKLSLITEICKTRSNVVSIIGDPCEDMEIAQQHLEQRGFCVAYCENQMQISMFSTILVFGSERITKIHDCIRMSDSPEFATTLVDTVVDVNDFLKIQQQDAASLPAEVFVIRNGEAVRFSRKNSSILDEFQRNYFRDIVGECFPALREHLEKIYVVYAGASTESAISSIKFDHIVADVRQGLALGFSKIIFYNGDENMQQPSLLTCQRVAEYLADEIPADSLFYFCAGHESQEYYNKVFQQGNWRYRMHMMAALRFELVMKNLELLKNSPLLTDPYEVKQKPKNYLCFNRMPRWHRVVLLSKLLSKELVDDSYYSFDLDGLNYPNCGPEVANKVMEPLEQAKHRFPMVLNRTSENDNPVSLSLDDAHYYRTSYFSIVNETCYYSGKYWQWSDFIHAGTTFFSEKVFKPLAHKHPFILVSTPGSLAQLVKFGYKSFAPHIDETYDNIVDDDLRMEAIVAEIQRLCDQTPEQWLEWQQAVAPIVEHNYNWFLADKDLSVTKHIDKYFI